MKSGFLKALILGMGISLLSTGMVIASAEEIQPTQGETQAGYAGSGSSSVAGKDAPQTNPTDIQILPAPDANTAVSSTAVIDEALLQKQSEIDKYVFEDHKDEITAKGISVAYTGPVGDVVEIGITPYTDENAKYFYDIFGTEKVKVVEGQKAQLLDAEPATDSVLAADAAAAQEIVTDAKVIMAPSNDIQTTSVQESAAVSSNTNIPMTIVYSVGALIVLAATALIIKNKAVAAKK